MKTKEAHIEGIAKVIKANRIMFISHIFGFYADIGRGQFYNLGLDKCDTLINAINENRCQAKVHMTNKWIGSDNPTLQIAAFKLMATDEERRLLSQQHVDITSGGKSLTLEVNPELAKLMKEDEDNNSV